MPFVSRETWCNMYNVILCACITCFLSVFAMLAHKAELDKRSRALDKRERELDQIERWLDQRTKQLELEHDRLNEWKRLHVRM